MTIGQNLKRLRERAQMTQATLGLAASVKQSDISKWEKKGQVPTIKPLMRLARALAVPVEELLRGVDEEYDRTIAARAEAAHDGSGAKKPYGLTSLVPGDGVQQTASPDQSGGPRDASSADRSRVQSEAQLRDLFADRYGFFKQIYDATDAIRAAADGLRARIDRPPQTNHVDAAKRGESGPGVPRRTRRRGGKR